MSDETNADEGEGPVIGPTYEGSSALSIDDLPRTGENDDAPPPAQEPAEGKAPGYKQVDFEKDDRAAIEQRFHRLYGQMKQSQAMVDQMTVDQRTLHEKLSNIEVGQVQTNVATHMKQLQGQLQEAMDVGDAAKSTAVIRQISQLEARASAPPPKQQAAPQQQEQQEHPDVSAIRNWSSSRAWAQEGHEDRSWAAFQLNDLYTSPEWADRPVSEKLGEVERRYTELSGTKQSSRQAPVLDQKGETRRRSSGTSGKLSDAQKAVALRMFDDKPREEAYKLYAQGLE
tara:strand:- start:4647 stop:5501 length:855 start_codon:yes stop_codon:yes gene_type:complete